MALKRRDPAAYRDELARIEARILGTPTNGHAPAAPPAPPVAARSLDSFAEHLRRAYASEDTPTGKLSAIRRSVIYACVTLRADMLSSLPILLYRMDKTGGGRGEGRVVSLSDPIRRMGMPIRHRGMRLADAGDVTQIESSPVLDLLRRPNPDWTGRNLIRMTETGLGLVGQAHWLLERGESGTAKPTEIGWVKHSRMEVVKPGPGSTDRTIAGWIMDAFTARRRELTPGEVVWMRYPDPEDPDYGALAPAAVASLGSESYQEAMRSNRDIFRRGLAASGMVVPPEGQSFATPEQMAELERDLGRKLMGQPGGGRHRLAVVGERLEFQSLSSLTPHDAEFVALLEFAIEDVARSYRIPIEFVGGTRRTYQNAEAAQTGIWMMALEPEACWLAEELSAKLLPAFGLDDSYFLAFDLSGVPALQVDEMAAWRREKEQMEAGVLQASEWRQDHGMEALESQVSLSVGQVQALVELVTSVGQGLVLPDQAKAIIALGLGMGDEVAAKIVGGAAGGTTSGTPPSEAMALADLLRSAVRDSDPEPRPRAPSYPDFGSSEHRRVMRARDDALAPHERRIGATARALLERQRESMLDKLKGQRAHSRMSLAEVAALFNRARWVREFREAMRPELARVVDDAGGRMFDDLSAPGSFDPGAPPVLNFLRASSQRFAVEVNETTWERLKESLAEGIDQGEDIPALSSRVSAVMADRIRSAPETIARTETLRAYSGGSQLAAKQTGLELDKTWLTALDERVRKSHAAAHGQTVGLDDDFRVGGASGPGPGLMGVAGEDINCRCTVVYSEVERRMVMLEVSHGRGHQLPLHAAD